MRVSTLKNAFGRTRLTAVLCSLLFVFVVACGDDDNTNNGTSNNGGGNNGGVDAGDTNGGGGDDGGSDQDGGGNDQDGGNDADNDTGNPTCEGLEGLACDPICQTGCAEGEACVAGRASASDPLTASCLPAGQGTQGDACGQQAGCAAGFGCFTLEEGGDSQCLEICDPTEGADACGTAEASCARQDQNLDYGLCIVTTDECDLLDDTTCPDAGTSCMFTPNGNECVTYNDTASAGDSCTANSDCNMNQQCAALTSGTACRDLCNQDTPCEGENMACAQVSTQDNPDDILYAVCVAQQ